MRSAWCAGILLMLAAACSTLERGGATTHIAMTLERNLVVVRGTAGGTAGRFLLGTAAPATILDRSFPAAVSSRGRVAVTLGERFATRVAPVEADLGGLADGILGADVWRGRSVTIDYRRGVVVIGRGLDPLADAVRFAFRTEPAVRLRIDGTETTALIDTASPEAMVLPSRTWGAEGRRHVAVDLGELSLAQVDALVAPVATARVGNRLLARFLVTIDYSRREVALWRRSAPAPPSAP